MPTQEEINAANIELQVANDNYAALQDRLNKYNQIFKTFTNLSPEQQQNPRLREAMTAALNDYNNLKVQQLANEDRVAAAQNAINNYNAALITQPQIVNQQRRRAVSPQYATPITNMVGGMSTPNGVTRGNIQLVKTPQYATPITNMVGGMSTPNGVTRGNRAIML